MEQIALYSMISKVGAKVLLFEDHPGFFGNWRAIVSHRHKTLEIVSDHRESWLQLWEIRPGQQNIELRTLGSLKLNETEELSLIQTWLIEVANA